MAERTLQGSLPDEGRQRAVIENVTPNVDEGRFAAKRVAGDSVVVEADCRSAHHVSHFPNDGPSARP